jgi:hypothetical protein
MQYDEHGNKRGYLSKPDGCEVAIAEGADLEAAMDDLEKFQTPAPKRQVERWLAELSVLSAKRQDDGFSEALRLEAYATRLCQYPADIARNAVLGHSWKFWPTWSELEQVCENLASVRRSMAASLRRRSEPQPQDPGWRQATAEERQRAQELIDRLFPSRSFEERKAAVDEAMKGYCMRDTPKTFGKENSDA